MNKCVWTLDVNAGKPGVSYDPEMTAITVPLMKRYAEKIGADFQVITDRKFQDWPIPCEKFQISELGKDYDWNFYFDIDTLIHPDAWDFSSVLTKDVTCSYGTDFVPQRFRPDKYFMRDGRMIGKGNWIAIVSNWCLDYWHFPPEDQTAVTAAENIFPLQEERSDIGTMIERTMDQSTGQVREVRHQVKKTVVDPSHLIDDYTVSRNISRFGLKHVLRKDLLSKYGRQDEGNMLAHQYLLLPEQKVVWMKQTVQSWGVKL